MVADLVVVGRGRDREPPRGVCLVVSCVVRPVILFWPRLPAAAPRPASCRPCDEHPAAGSHRRSTGTPAILGLHRLTIAERTSPSGSRRRPFPTIPPPLRSAFPDVAR